MIADKLELRGLTFFVTISRFADYLALSVRIQSRPGEFLRPQAVVVLGTFALLYEIVEIIPCL